VVIVQAPKAGKGKKPPREPNGRLTAALLKDYAAAGDIHAVDSIQFRIRPERTPSGRTPTSAWSAI
jgi:hypothetical protein